MTVPSERTHQQRPQVPRSARHGNLHLVARLPRSPHPTLLAKPGKDLKEHLLEMPDVGHDSDFRIPRPRTRPVRRLPSCR